MPTSASTFSPSSKKSKQSFLCVCVTKFLKMFGVSTAKQEPFYETLAALKTRGQKMSKEEKNILTNFLKFGHKEVGDVMVNKADVSAISIKSTVEEASQAIIKKPHTRTIVFQDTMDNIAGFIHIKDLMYVVTNNDSKASVKKIIRKPLLTTSGSKLIDLLVEMRRKRTHMAIVVDEYGCTEGIVTIEDIVEEIVGDIEDEHEDKNNGNHDYTVVSDGVIISHARVDIEDIEQVVNRSLKEGDEHVETIGGLAMIRAGHVPKTGDIINLAENVVAEVLDANARSVKRLKIIYSDADEG